MCRYVVSANVKLSAKNGREGENLLLKKLVVWKDRSSRIN